ncbi:PH domain-containing protein [Streptomyces sp. NBC_01142]|uniref:PH domain-containing protein n=1 Tax=Streptomyces sp. NBC_01142 TaxID=2975865 RepID=UPI00224D616D|nr:PH domain-containing protein [Streptomyces sp. NBC_01142]MCX4818941.1 PH domain-containing protein [Streptomyces sp. NBC_01142]
MTSPHQPAEPTYADRVFRSPAAMAGGVLLLALVAWMASDALVRGEGRTPWLALAGALLAVPLVVAYTLRPAVFANDDRLRIRNPWRTITLPWAAVANVRAGYSSEVFTQDGTKYQLWAVPVSLRQRNRALRRSSAAADVPDHEVQMASGDRTVAELRELAKRNASAPGAKGEPQIRWAYEVVAPAAAGAVLLAVLLAIG